MKKWKPGLSTRILLGLICGIAAGVLFGEYCAPLSVLGDAFVGLLQMTVLPFVIVSLIGKLGRLKLLQSRKLAWNGGITLLLLWSVGLIVVLLLPQAFPQWKSGSFFSTAITSPPPDFDLMAIFIPANLFASLAENYVPAVVLFCICVGVALGQVDAAGKISEHLEIWAQALMRVSMFVARFTPLGVFAISASMAGTISLDEIGRLQAYLLAYTGGALLLGLVVLPLLVVSCTPFSYRDVLSVSRDAVIMAFATGKLILVLPILIERTETLFARRREENAAPAADILYPIAYPFPHLGKLLALLFLPFAAWFLGRPMPWQDFASLLPAGVLSYFGGPILATPFLLEQAHLPSDMFHLFLLTGVYCGMFSDALGAMHLVAFTLITTSLFTGTFRLRLFPIARFAVASLFSFVLLLAGLHYALQQTLAYFPQKEDVIAEMHLLERLAETTVLEKSAANPDPLLPRESLLERVKRRKAIRVGFNEDNLPFAYRNGKGELVGFDINMAHALARDMGVRLELVPFQHHTLAEQLERDEFDLAMSGIVGTLERAAAMHHTEPYMDVTLALVVPDFRARDFRSLAALREQESLKIGYVELSAGFVDRLQESLPRAELIRLESNHDFFINGAKQLDALLISAESGSAFTLLYPDFEVVVPEGRRVSLPLIYAIGNQDEAMGDFVEHWFYLHQKDGAMQEFTDHWILGKTPGDKQPRWSVIRNVLGWVD